MNSVHAIGASSPYQARATAQQCVGTQQQAVSAPARFAGQSQQNPATSKFLLGGVGEVCAMLAGCCVLVPAIAGLLLFKKIRG